jgi:hypothetical protein
MTPAKRAKNTRREQLFLLQRHAWEHHASRAFSRTCQGLPDPPRQWSLPCPICGEVAHMRSGEGTVLTEDHAPQRSGASLLGDPTLVVLTCETCNGDANLKYERFAASPDVTRIDGAPGACPAHGARSKMTTGILVPQHDAAWALTDLKSALLIAFATLGYGWVTGKQLEPVRAAVRDGQLPPRGACAIVQFNDELEGDLVLEVGSHPGGVAVRSKSGIGVLFPGVDQTSVSVPAGRVQLRQHDWPVIAGSHKQLEVARGAGTLFHMDFCRNHRLTAHEAAHSR